MFVKTGPVYKEEMGHVKFHIHVMYSKCSAHAETIIFDQ
jgi:hypothetical protein